MLEVGKLSDLKEDSPLYFENENTKIAVFLVDGKPVATQANCPHANGPLHKGSLCDHMLSCPWHGWSYDLNTGECEEDPGIKLAIYPVSIEKDTVCVSLVEK